MSTIRQRSIYAVPGPQPRAEEGLGLAQLPRILRRSIGWIVGPTLVVALGASVFVNVVSPRYTGEAKVLLESRDPAFARTAQERGDQLAPIDEQAVASQVQVAMSRDLAREAIRRLKLVGNAEFDPGAGGSARSDDARHRRQSSRPPRRGPGARRLFRSPAGLSRRQVADPDDRVPREGSEARGRGRQHHREALHRLARSR